MEQNNDGGQKSLPILAVCGPKFMKFTDNVEDLSSYQRPCPIVYVTYRSEDNRH